MSILSRLKAMFSAPCDWQDLPPPPTPAPPPSLPPDVAGDLRQAQQRLASGARLVRAKSARNKELADTVTRQINDYLAAREAALKVFDVIEGGRGQHDP